MSTKPSSERTHRSDTSAPDRGIPLFTLALLIFCMCLVSTRAGAAPDEETAPPPSPVPTPQSLTAISRDLEALHDLRRQLGHKLAETSTLEEITTSINETETTELPKIRKQVATLEAEPRLDELLDADTALHSLNERLSAYIEVLEADIRQSERDGDEIDARLADWEQLAGVAAAAEAPAVIREREAEAERILADLAASVAERRNRSLELLDRAAGLRTEVTEFRDGLAARIAVFEKETLASASQPLWQTDLQHPRAIASAVRHYAALDLRRVAEYTRAHGVKILIVFSLVLAAGLFVTLLVRRRISLAGADDPASTLSPVLAHPVSAAALLALAATLALAPPGPQIVDKLLWALMALPAAHLTASLLGRRSVLPIALVTATVLLWPLRTVFEAVPLFDRLLLLAEDAVGIAAVLLITRRGLVLDRLSVGWRSLVRLVLWTEAVLLAVSFIAGIFGELGVARVLRDGAVVSLGLMMVLYGTVRALLRIVGDVLRGPVGAQLRMVRLHPESALAMVRKAIVVVSLAVWVWLSLGAFHLTRPLQSLVQQILDSGFEVGWFNVTFGEVLAFFASVAAAFLIARVVCFVLDEEFLPRLPLGRGVPYMISTSIRYLILLAGFALALAALGVDPSKATILAGAFGVGIGFGLQNVVNNFVSGLILLFERPIRVGDFVEVSGVLGEVTRISIRSSIIRTFVGSEVIVPNGDLISKDVTNWTLSNSRRLVEVLVGVAYGSDPHLVSEVLKKVAEKHEEVLAEPQPAAYFISFGDSQLDFRLVCWVANFGDAYRVAGELRVAVTEAFDEAGIEIPFPQQDLRVVSGGTSPTESSVSKTEGGHSTV